MAQVNIDDILTPEQLKIKREREAEYMRNLRARRKAEKEAKKKEEQK